MVNNGFPRRMTVGRIREKYSEGCRVELIEMDDPYSRLSPGEQGTVSLVDDMGTVFVDWDCGSHLGVAYGADRIRKL
ncbi:MAG: DUF4314 domain-containing protein [Lachnospiraceae bacterium]|nr:DUF4314 domain-containing protein [Lachnospiraceae bacterium]